MLAENLENWAKRERQEGRQEGERIGVRKGEQIGVRKGRQETARNLLKLGVLSDTQIAQVTGLDARSDPSPARGGPALRIEPTAR